MTSLKRWIVGLVCLCTLPWVWAETWKVTSLDWQPFSGKALPEGGAGIAVLRAALKAEGIDLVVEFYPWTRAIDTAKDPAYAGVYPSWPEDVGDGFIKSPVLFKSPVGFVEPKAKPLVWNKLEDLKGKTIGTVQDYGNTPEFMALIKNGTIKTQVVVDDLTNIKKVAGGRIDGAFIDLANLDYFLKNDAKDVAASVQANSKVIDTKDLVLGINEKFANKKAAEIVKRGISKIDPDKIIKEYMAKHIK
ncbi:transporter substrate-binding domain-containing protein [Curvibacter sp. APW13]|uniref:substrate-binding periplasmic protein n=1 Tax=Curvibacter sp. APW13 TaxID=3077236 RepID=UPI0028DFEBCD|nr:transporter substrate-binding domain-containing protein [Curvibacter sp. APW13]MDT8989431.1 transporter substrate-binding domain-containing protein [Curvibacter sp. APW13]